MADTSKENEDRLRRATTDRPEEKRTGESSSFVAVNTLAKPKATEVAESVRTDERSTTEKIDDTFHKAKEDARRAVGLGPEWEQARTEDERRRAAAGTAAAVGTAAAAGKAMTRAGETSEETAPTGTQGQHWRGEPLAKNPKIEGTGGLEETPASERTGAEKKLGAVGATAVGTAAVAGAAMTRPGAEGEKRTDWEEIKHPGMVPCDTDPYGTRPVSELTPPSEITDKADLAAVRMMERDREEQERMKTGAAVTGATMAGAAGARREDEDIMSLATEEAAAARTAKAAKEPTEEHKKTGAAMVGAAAAGTAVKEVRETRTTTETRLESEADRERARAAATGAALGAGAAASRAEPAAAERTTRAGAAIDTDTTHHVVTERPVTGTVVPPGVTTTTPLTPYGAVDERTRRHAEDPSVHPDWETQPQINAPRDVGIPTAEGQADAARIRAGRRRSDEAKEPRIERRGDDIDVPAASGARVDTDRGVIGATKDVARDITDATKETARGVTDATKKAARDVDRKI